MTTQSRLRVPKVPNLRRSGGFRSRPLIESLEGRQLLTTSVLEFPMMPTGSFVGQMAAGPGGDVWFLKQQKQGNDFSLELASTLARISSDGTVTDYPLPGPQGPFDGPQAIATAPDGSLFILTESLSGSGPLTFGIDRIASDGKLTELTLSKSILTGEFYKYGIHTQDFSQIRPTYTSLHLTVGSDGNFWVASGQSSGGGIRPFTLLDRIAPDGTVTEIPTGRYDQGPLVAASDGSVWFATFISMTGDTELARVSTDGTVTDYALPGGEGSQLSIASLTAGTDGNIWFSETSKDSTASPQIGRITSSGQITEFPLTNPGGAIGQLIAGPNGNVWFTETVNTSTDPLQSHAYKVGEIDSSGVVIETTIVSSSNAYVDSDAGSITVGPNGQLWFAENSYAEGHGSIGELMLASTGSSPSNPPSTGNPGHGSSVVAPPTSPPVQSLQAPVNFTKNSQVVLNLNPAATPAAVRLASNYTLKAQAYPGLRGHRHAHNVRINSAVYNAARHTVTLHVLGHFDPRLVYQLTFNDVAIHSLAGPSTTVLGSKSTGEVESALVMIVPKAVRPTFLFRK